MDNTMVALITPGILHPCHLGLNSLGSLGREMSLGFVSVALAFCLFCFPLASSQLTKFSLFLSEEGYHIL